jgi:hypothetical protein
MKTIALLILVAVLTCGVGCAKSDWIQQTLVTADVTGVWIGSVARGNYLSSEVRLELEQQGPKVTGYLRVNPPHIQYRFVDGPVEGTVTGDVFTFRQTNGILLGETTVNGDEMRVIMTAGTRVQNSLAAHQFIVPSPNLATVTPRRRWEV